MYVFLHLYLYQMTSLHSELLTINFNFFCFQVVNTHDDDEETGNSLQGCPRLPVRENTCMICEYLNERPLKISALGSILDWAQGDVPADLYLLMPLVL